MSPNERDVNKLVCLGKADSVQKLTLKSGADPDGRFKGVPHIIAAARAGVCVCVCVSISYTKYFVLALYQVVYSSIINPAESALTKKLA